MLIREKLFMYSNNLTMEQLAKNLIKERGCGEDATCIPNEINQMKHDMPYLAHLKPEK